MVAAGLGLIAAALLLMTQFQVDSAYGIVALAFVVLGLGIGMAMAPATDSVMGSLPLAKASVGSAVNDATRTTGGALGVAVLGSILSSGYRGDMDGDRLAASAAPAAPRRTTRSPARWPWRGRIGGATGDRLAVTAQEAFVNGMHAAVVVAAAVAVAGALVALVFLPSREAARAGAGARPAAAAAAAGAGGMSETAQEGRRPGRPRSAAADASIVRATLELLLEGGYRGLTMEQVRARAGVGKATLYRRYGSKQELVAEAVRHINQPIPVPDTGSVRDDILAIAQSAIEGVARVGAATFIPRMLAEAAGDPEMHAIFYANLVAPRRAIMAGVLRAAIDRGELRADLDVEQAIDVLTGPWVYRMLISGGDTSAAVAVNPSAVLDLVLPGMLADASGGGPKGR